MSKAKDFLLKQSFQAIDEEQVARLLEDLERGLKHEVCWDDVVTLDISLVAVQKAREEEKQRIGKIYNKMRADFVKGNDTLTNFYKKQAESYKADWETWNNRKDKFMEELAIRVHRETLKDVEPKVRLSTAKEIFDWVDVNMMHTNEVDQRLNVYKQFKKKWLSNRGQSDSEKK